MTRKPLYVLVGSLIIFGALLVGHEVIGPVEASAAAPPAVITDVVLTTSSGSMVGLEVLGSGFGTASPTKRLFIDGIQADVAEVYPWTDTKITVDEEVFYEITKGFIWVDHTYQWEIREGNAPISNVFPKAFLLEIHGVRPKSGPVGTGIELSGAGFGHPGDLILGRVKCEIVTRTPGKIQAVVPLVPPGNHVLGIRQGTKLISSTVPFSVTPAKKIGKG